MNRRPPIRLRATLAASAAVLGALVAACAAPTSGSGAPPTLHIGTGGDVSAMAGEAVAPAAAGPDVPTGGIARMPVRAGYVLAGDLPTEPTKAPVWRWPAGDPDRTAVTGLAAALGISGEPQRHAHGWLVTSAAGELRVSDGEGWLWSYARADIANCPPYGVDVDNLGGGFGCAMASGVVAPSTTGPSVAPVPAPPTPTAASGPDAAATRAAAGPLLAALGVSGNEQVDVGGDSSTLTVSPLVRSMPTFGFETRIDVDTRGIRAATGHLGSPAAGDVYPLRTAHDAFADLANQPQPMIAEYCGPVPAPSSAAAPPVEPNTKFGTNPEAGASAGATPSLPPNPAPVPCETPQPQRVTGATIGLLMASDGGTAVLVPAWFFTVEGQPDAVPVIAIAPRFLAPPADSGTGSGGASAGSAGSAGSVGSAGGGEPLPAASSVAVAPDRPSSG